MSKPMMPPKRKFNGGMMKRLVKMLFQSYPVMFPIAIFCIVFTAIVSAIPSIFLQKVIEAIGVAQEKGWSWEIAREQIVPKVLVLISFYVVAIISITLETQLMAVITQGFLNKFRKTMFSRMQDLPIRYFDTHKHGDIMSHYTNDIDTLRQLVSQSLPTLVRATVIVTTVFVIMLYYSIWLTLLMILGVIAMAFVSKKIGGGSAKYFIRLQKAVGHQEGFVQEILPQRERRR